MWKNGLTVIIVALGLAIAAPALAARHGKNAPDQSASCSVAGTAVNATGLPAGQLINFLITDSSGTYGWVLGYTDTGTWSVSVPPQDGTTTYQFVSKTWGPNGSKYDVFASCSS